MNQNTSHFRMPNLQTIGLMGMGFFSLSLQPTLSVLVPLWALYLHASAMDIGLAVAATSVLPFFYAIPIGSLVDRLGSRKLLLISALATVGIYGLYPFFPNVDALIGLQLVAGIFQSVNWQAAQSYAAKAGQDQERARVMARFGSASNFGTAVGPFMAGGLTVLGFHEAFWGVALWSSLLFFSVLIVKEVAPPHPGKMGVNILVPRVKDFLQAGILIRSPAILLVMFVTFLRLGMFSIRSSFFPVFLHNIAMPSDQIGLLIGIGSLASSVSAALVGSITRYVSGPNLLLGGLAVGIIGQCIAPISHSYFMQYLLSIVSGLGIGVTLPLMLTILADATPAHQRGLAVGLRNGMNRLSSTLVPLGLGVLVGGAGIRDSFYATGLFLMIGVAFAVGYQRHVLKNARMVADTGTDG